MLTFTDLINNNVAPSQYQTNIVGNDITAYDPFVINYNNIWGVVTDTHMAKGDDGNYYISGSLVCDANKVRSLYYDTHVGNYYYNCSSLGISTLYQYLIAYRRKAKRTIINGDWVILIQDMSENERLMYDNQDACSIRANNDQICAL